MATQIRRQRQATPARWQKAVERAIGEGIQVRQLAGSGGWVATSGSDTSTAYELDITGDVAHGCSCLAGLNGDLICKHRAAFYLAVGLLDPDPEPPAPAVEPAVDRAVLDIIWAPIEGILGVPLREPAPAAVRCPECGGTGVIYVRECELAGFPYPHCPQCGGAGQMPVRIVTLASGENTLAA